MPATSVLSARQLPDPIGSSVFAAPAWDARSPAAAARSSAARFNGIVQENPAQSGLVAAKTAGSSVTPQSIAAYRHRRPSAW